MGRKFKPSTRLTAVIIAILLRVLNSALAICGVIKQLGSLNSSWSVGSGSGIVTSSPNIINCI